MKQKIFDSKYPILECCMNRGSTLELALAVHNAGAYPSLCSWTYTEYPRSSALNTAALRKDLSTFVNKTKSNKIHISFELEEFSSDSREREFDWNNFRENIKLCHDMIREFAIPTVEIIYGNSNSPRPAHFIGPNVDDRLLELVQPLHDMGTKIFNRTYDIVSEETRKKFLFDGLCVKGTDSAGFGGTKYSVKELFLLQKQITPDAYIIPYGGIGGSAQVKEYIELGADVVAVGSMFAFSKESPIKESTKNIVVQSTSKDLQKFHHSFDVNNNTVHRKQSMIPLDTQFNETDDANHTRSLISGLYKSGNVGHVYIGNSINYINEILPVNTIVQNLIADLRLYEVE